MRLTVLLPMVGGLSLAGAASAAPITVSDPNGFLLVDNRANNSLGRATGERIVYGETSVVPNGNAGTTASASTIDLGNGAVSNHGLVFSGSPALPNEFSGSIPYNPNLTGAWTLRFANGTDTKVVTTPAVTGAVPPPFAKSVTFSGASTNPTFAWNYPVGSVNGVFFDIFDQAIKNASGGAALVYSKSLAGTTNSFKVPDALAAGLTLVQGHQYTLDLYGIVNRPGTTGLNNPNSLAWSESYFDFTPLPAGSPVVNLPALTATGAYQYNTGVLGGQTYFFDPTVAVGYDYATGAGDPNFASVLLPGVQAGPFSVSYLGGSGTVTALVAPGVAYAFPNGGVSAFRVRGIDPADGLDPANTLAFVTGLSFTGDGVFNGTQTPVTLDVPGAVPEPAAMAVMLAGLLGLGAARRGVAFAGRPADFGGVH